MKRTKKLIVVLIAIVASAFVVSTGLLTWYGKITTTANVQQSVVISSVSGMGPWINWNQEICRPLGQVVHCTDYCYKAWIYNRACSEAPVYIEDLCTSGDNKGFDITHYLFDGALTVHFHHKTGAPDWETLDGPQDPYANLTYPVWGKYFAYTLETYGLDPETEYGLVYYADQQSRFENWGGQPLMEIATFMGYDGDHSDYADIPTIPFTDDWNAGPDADYGDEHNGFDDYEHIKGAKLWILPTEDYTVDENGYGDLDGWHGADYLFEDDLILYIDCDAISPNSEPPLPCLKDVYPLFALEEPYVLQPNTVYCWITCYHVDLLITPGVYAFATYLKPTIPAP